MIELGLKKLYDPKDGQMRIVGLMSGSGTNLRKVLELQEQLEMRKEHSPFRMVAIFSDRHDSNAAVIGKDFDIPVIIRDIKRFYGIRGIPRSNMSVREEFDAETVKALSPYNATVAVYGGYMSIVTRPIIEAFLGINVHPADLSVMNGRKRKYVGDNAVRDAILAKEKYLHSTVHIVERQVDAGRIMMISSPLEVKVCDPINPEDKEGLKKVVDEHQTRLKEAGDWVVLPKTIQYLSEGRFSYDDNGSLYFDTISILKGLRLGDKHE